MAGADSSAGARKKIPKFLVAKISYANLHVKNRKKSRFEIFLGFAYNLLIRTKYVRVNEFLLRFAKLENCQFLYFVVFHCFSDGTRAVAKMPALFPVT